MNRMHDLRRIVGWVGVICLLTAITGCGDRPGRRKAKYRADKIPMVEVADSGEDAKYGPTGGAMDLTNAASIKGLVKFNGAPPVLTDLDLSKDVFCQQGYKVQKEDLVVGTDGGLRDMFVFIERGLDGKGYPKPNVTPRVIQEGCKYIPHVLPVRVGYAFEVENKDNANHNYHFLGKKNPEINKSQNSPMVNTETFHRTELGAAMKCDVHPWMFVNIHVMDHGCYAVSAPDGQFEVKGIPPGTYRLSFMHERKSIKLDSIEITIAAGETKDLGTLTTK